MRQNVIVGVKAAHQEAEAEREKEVPVSQHPLQGHVPNDLTSSTRPHLPVVPKTGNQA
jgi:hypothetical protein